MQYCALKNGQQQLVGAHSQRSQTAPHFSHDAKGNPQAVAANNVLQYRTANAGVQSPQSAHFNLHIGAYPARQTLNEQTSVGPNQVVSSHRTGGENPSISLFKMWTGEMQSSSSNVQSGNPGFRTSNGYQVARQQAIHQNSATHSQPTRMTANTVYSQQGLSAYWKQSPVAHERQSKTSQHVCTSPLVSATANSQAAHNQLYRQNSTQHGFSPSTPSTSSNMATSLSFRNATTATNLSPSAPVLYNTNISQKTQQYPAQLSSSYSSGVNANSSPNSNSYNQNKASCFLTKTRELSSYPDAVQHQMLRDSMSAAYLGQYTARPDGPPSSCISSAYRGRQCVGNSRMVVSNQNTQPVTSVDCIQGRPLHSGQSLTESPESAMSRATHPVNVPSQQNSAPNVFCSNPAGDGSGRNVSDNGYLPIGNTNSNGLLARLLSDASHLLAEDTSPQMKTTQSSKAKSCEMPEMQSSLKQNDSSILLSPGHTGTRAVAVVQPLTLESYASAHPSSNMPTGESSSYPEKVCILQSVANPIVVYVGDPAGPSQLGSNNSRVASNDYAALVTSETISQNLASVVDISTAKTTQKSVVSEAQVGPNSPKDKSKKETPPAAHVFELSSLPATSWTAVDLANLIQEGEKTQMNLKPSTETALAQKLLHMFWNNSYKELINKLKTGCHVDTIMKVHQYCKTHVTSDSVILWQIKQGCMEQLKNFHVLKDDDVYSEVPYKSSWLNVNEQVNDIDNEFDCQVDQVKTVNHIPPPVLSDVPKKVVPGAELNPVNSGKEKQAYTADAPTTQTSSTNETVLEPAYPDKETQASTVKAPSTQTASPSETESADSSDDCYSFKIQVLPPEEAKRIFGQIQSNMDTVHQAENITSRSVEGDRDATLSKLKPDNENIGQIQHICCVSKWMEIILGSDTPHLNKCKCKEEQSPKEITDRALDQEKKDDLCGISKVHPTMAADNPLKVEENFDMMTSSHPKFLNKPIHIIDLTDNDNIPHSSSDQETKDIPHMSNNTQSNVILVHDSEDEDLPNTETEMMSEPEDECGQEGNKSAGTEELSSSVGSEKQPEKFNVPDSESSIQMSGHSESVDRVESPMESKGQAQMSEKADLKTSFSHCVKHERKRKTLSSQDSLFPLQNESKKCKHKVHQDSQHQLEVLSKHGKVSADVTQLHPSLSNVKTVELVLFGSAQQEKCVLKGTRKSHVSSSEGLSNEAYRPPKVLSVNLNAFGKESGEAASRGEHSAKRLIYENWKRSFQLTNISQRNKPKTEQCPSASSPGPSFKKGKLPVSPRRRASLGYVKLSQDLYKKKKRSLSHELNLGEKPKKYIVTLKQPAEHDRNNTKGQSTNVLPLQANNVLRFSVLPKTFTFKDGSGERKDTTDPFSDTPDLDEAKDQSSDKAAKKAKGSWFPNEKKRSPLCSPPETPSLFHRFQKKYIEKTQISTDQ